MLRYDCLPYMLGENVCMACVSDCNRSLMRKSTVILGKSFFCRPERRTRVTQEEHDQEESKEREEKKCRS